MTGPDGKVVFVSLCQPEIGCFANFVVALEALLQLMASRKRKPWSPKEKLNISAVVDKNPKRKRTDIASELRLNASTLNTTLSKRKETGVRDQTGPWSEARGTGGSTFEVV